MKDSTFDNFWKEHKPGLIELINSIQLDIEDDFIQEGDDEPSIQLTISVNPECDEWTYQTGDNSFTGSCYHHPYWGVSSVYRDSDAEELADYLIDDLSNQIQFGD